MLRLPLGFRYFVHAPDTKHPSAPAQCKGQATGFVDGQVRGQAQDLHRPVWHVRQGQEGARGCGKFVKGSGCKGKSLAAFFLDVEESTALSKTN